MKIKCPKCGKETKLFLAIARDNPEMSVFDDAEVERGKYWRLKCKNCNIDISGTLSFKEVIISAFLYFLPMLFFIFFMLIYFEYSKSALLNIVLIFVAIAAGIKFGEKTSGLFLNPRIKKYLATNKNV